MAKKKKKKQREFTRYLSITIIIISVIFLGLSFFINLLPNQYLLIALLLIGIIDLITIIFLFAKSVVKKIIGVLLAIIIVIIMVLGINYELSTMDFLKQLGFNSYKTESYNVIVLKNSAYKDIKDFPDLEIGRESIASRPGLENALKELKKITDFQEKEFADITDLTTNLLNESVSAIILENSEINIIAEENYEIFEKLEIIKTIKIKLKLENLEKEVDITKKPFNIYLSGIDTYDSIAEVSRSDVNMLLTVNPKTHQILLTNIPRDYYVLLSKIDEYDKLTHAGIYGIETSIGTIENLLNTTINYYVKVNFTTLINLIDSLGGITIDSPYDFTTIDGYSFKKGVNELNGEEALSFSRERKSFKNGDRTRGKNQQIILTAIIKKVMSKAIITNYKQILSSLKGNINTNLDDTKIKNFIKKQTPYFSDYTIDTNNLNGTNDYAYTYSYKKNKLYVMKPEEESLKTSQEKINDILNKTNK